MTDRRKDILYLALLLALLMLYFSKILFTDKIIRAPDITNEFYWTVKGFKDMGFLDLFRITLQPTWDLFINGGTSEGGGTLSMQFLLYRNLIFWLFPAPANVAWFMVLQMFFGAAGTFLYCRTIGASRLASFLGGLIFALAPENASLINAGHVQKIATISFAPWAFFFFEKGFQSRRADLFPDNRFCPCVPIFQHALADCLLYLSGYWSLRYPSLYRHPLRRTKKPGEGIRQNLRLKHGYNVVLFVDGGHLSYPPG